MKDILSYALYESRGCDVDRTYDRHARERWRYWSNLPSVVLVASHLFPNHAIRLHIDEQSSHHPLFDFLQALTADHPRVEVRLVKRDTSRELPMLWRMLPLWDADVRYCHPRDIDSLPTLAELRAVRYFEQHEQYLIQGMRSHPDHNGPSCRILGGLCGFRADAMRRGRKIPSSFDLFAAMARGNRWGDDLELLRRYFVDRRSWFFRRRILDTLLTDSVRPYRHKRTSVASERELGTVETGDVDRRVLDLLSRTSTWSGQPVQGRGETLREMLTLGGAAADSLRRCIGGSAEAREFYGV